MSIKHGTLNKRRIGWTIALIMLLTLGLGSLTPASSGSYVRKRRFNIYADRKLKILSKYVQFYMKEHDGRRPDSLQQLTVGLFPKTDPEWQSQLTIAQKNATWKPQQWAQTPVLIVRFADYILWPSNQYDICIAERPNLRDDNKIHMAFLHSNGWIEVGRFSLSTNIETEVREFFMQSETRHEELFRNIEPTTVVTNADGVTIRYGGMSEFL